MDDLLAKITTGGKAMYLAYDQGLEHGPDDFNSENIDPEYILKIAVEGNFNAIILQKGIAKEYYKDSSFEQKIPLILKLNGKTNLNKGEAYSPQICEVDEAIELGASAVGYTIYPGSEFENKMFKEFGKIVRDAHSHNVPAIAWVYPRGKSIKDEDVPETIAYATRIGLELEADMVKVKYSGSKESFRWAVKAAGKTKVVLSGGEKIDEKGFLKILKDVMEAGAAGAAIGRNIWKSKSPLDIARKARNIIFG